MTGDVAQMVERSLSMREVWGSIPHFSKKSLFSSLSFLFLQSLYLGIITTAHDRAFQQVFVSLQWWDHHEQRGLVFIAMVEPPRATLASARTGSH